MQIGPILGDEPHCIIAADVKNIFLGGDFLQAVAYRGIIRVPGEADGILHPDEHDVDPVLLQPADRRTHGVLEFLRRDPGKRVIGSQLPKNEVRIPERDLALDSLRRVLRHFSGDPAVEDHDIDALEGMFEDRFELRGIAHVLRRGPVPERRGRTDRENAHFLALLQRRGHVGQRGRGGDIRRRHVAGRAHRRRGGRRARSSARGAGITGIKRQASARAKAACLPKPPAIFRAIPPPMR